MQNQTQKLRLAPTPIPSQMSEFVSGGGSGVLPLSVFSGKISGAPLHSFHVFVSQPGNLFYPAVMFLKVINSPIFSLDEYVSLSLLFLLPTFFEDKKLNIFVTDFV